MRSVAMLVWKPALLSSSPPLRGAGWSSRLPGRRAPGCSSCPSPPPPLRRRARASPHLHLRRRCGAAWSGARRRARGAPSTAAGSGTLPSGGNRDRKVRRRFPLKVETGLLNSILQQHSGTVF